MNEILKVWGPAIIAGVVSIVLAVRNTRKELDRAKTQAVLTNTIENRTFMKKDKLEKAGALYAEISSYVLTSFRAQFRPFLQLPKRKLTKEELGKLTAEVWDLGKDEKTWSDLEILLAYFPKIQLHFHNVRRDANLFTTIEIWTPLVKDNPELSEDEARHLQDRYMDLANRFIEVEDEVLAEITHIQGELEAEETPTTR